MRRYTWSDYGWRNDSIYCKFTTAISIPIPGGEAVALQSSLDTLFLGLVPLLLTFGCKKLLDKNVNINWIMVGIFVLSLMMAVVHIV